jgi:hypothetical protein
MEAYICQEVVDGQAVASGIAESKAIQFSNGDID